jgi:hypothetical protein
MVFGVVRIIILPGVDFNDFTYCGITIHILTISEAAVAIIIASSPMLRPILNRVTDGTLFSINRSSSSSNRKAKEACSQSNATSVGIFTRSMGSNSQELVKMGGANSDNGAGLIEIRHVTVVESHPRSSDDIEDMERIVYQAEDNESAKVLL